MSALPASNSPEIVPALDESRPTFGENMAADIEFGKKVLEYCWRNHLYPQVLQQETLWPVWRQIDDAWRVKGASYDLDISAVDPITAVTSPDAKGKGGGIVDRRDGYSARVFPATLHQQIVAKTNTHMAVAWGDGLPVHADPDDDEPEHPLYNPIQQSCIAQNKLLKKCAERVRLKHQDRKGRGAFCKFGHAWVATDYVQEFEDKEFAYPVPMDPMMAQAMVMDLSQRFGSQPEARQTVFGQELVWRQKVVKQMHSNFIPLRVDDVFVDQTLPADEGLKHQLCVAMRQRTNRASLFGNEYDPVNKPFGWLNTQQACMDGNPQWQYDGMSNNIFQEELRKKWGLSITGQVPSQNQSKSIWTMYVMLAIYRDPKEGTLMLDDGTGIECPTCKGSGWVSMEPEVDMAGNLVGTFENAKCPECEGRTKLFIRPERYVVQAYGNLESSNARATCLRIQRNPTPKDRVPILYSAVLTEDTAGAIPLSKSEAALKSNVQEATAVNQWFDAKNQAVNPQWLIPEDADIRRDYNRPNTNITHFGNPDQFQPMRAQLDPTANLMPFIQMCRDDQMAILNMSPQLLGEINQGRRSATELQNAFDAGRVPVLQEIDQYGEDILAGWAQMFLEAVEAFADRDWIQQQTGRTTFGKVKLVASVGDEFLKRSQMLGNFQYVAQLLAQRPDANIQPVFAAMCQLMKLPINANEVLPDGGVKKAASDALKIVTQILGSGQFMPAAQDDPHAIYIEVFTQALKDPYWQQNTPETLPLLQMRLQQQMQFQLLEQQAQLMAQQQAMALQNPPKEGEGKGSQPAKSREAAATSGGQNQQTFGAQQS